METDEDRSRPGMLRELAVFLGRNKRWWLVPILLVLLLLAILVLAGRGAAAPFVYSMFRG